MATAPSATVSAPGASSSQQTVVSAAVAQAVSAASAAAAAGVNPMSLNPYGFMPSMGMAGMGSMLPQQMLHLMGPGFMAGQAASMGRAHQQQQQHNLHHGGSKNRDQVLYDMTLSIQEAFTQWVSAQERMRILPDATHSEMVQVLASRQTGHASYKRWKSQGYIVKDDHGVRSLLRRVSTAPKKARLRGEDGGEDEAEDVIMAGEDDKLAEAALGPNAATPMAGAPIPAGAAPPAYVLKTVPKASEVLGLIQQTHIMRSHGGGRVTHHALEERVYGVPRILVEAFVARCHECSSAKKKSGGFKRKHTSNEEKDGEPAPALRPTLMSPFPGFAPGFYPPIGGMVNPASVQAAAAAAAGSSGSAQSQMNANMVSTMAAQQIYASYANAAAGAAAMSMKQKNAAASLAKDEAYVAGSGVPQHYAQEIQAYYMLTQPPAYLQSQEARMTEFLSRVPADARVVAITSGGTLVPLEKHMVRCVDNFSTGVRGAALAERFLEQGAYVVMLRRSGSAVPFLRRMAAVLAKQAGAQGNPQLSSLATLQSLRVLNGTLSLELPHNPAAASAVASINEFQGNFSGRFLDFEFTSMNDYLFSLRSVCRMLKPLQRRAAVLLAAAVSDFHISETSMSLHKMDSRSGNGLDLHMDATPKVLWCLRNDLPPQPNFFQPPPADTPAAGAAQAAAFAAAASNASMAWCPQAFVCSFKLETDASLLVRKSRAALASYGVNAVLANQLETRYEEMQIILPAPIAAASAAAASGVPDAAIDVVRRGDGADEFANELENQVVPRLMRLQDVFMAANVKHED